MSPPRRGPGARAPRDLDNNPTTADQSERQGEGITAFGHEDTIDDRDVRLAEVFWRTRRRYSDTVRSRAGWRAEYRKAGVL